MPGQRRQRRPESQRGGTAGEILSEIFGTVFDFVGEHVAEAAPRCELCDDFAVPLRCACGRFGCRTHGYFNFSLGKAICPTCARHVGAPVDTGEDDEDEAPPPTSRSRQRPRQQRARRAAQRPSLDAVTIAWEVLGLDPEAATEADVNKAFRQAARDCHPDLHPGDTQAARKFRALRQSTDLCVADLAARREE